MTGCPLRGGANLWKVKNVVFVCIWDHEWVSTKGVRLFVCDWDPKGGVHSWELKNVGSVIKRQFRWCLTKPRSKTFSII